MNFSIDENFLYVQREFADKTWPHQTYVGIIAHARKELDEIEKDPADLEEWVDGILLLTGGAMRMGFEPQDLLDKVKFKLEKNMSRNWPKPEDQNPEAPSEHIEE